MTKCSNGAVIIIELEASTYNRRNAIVQLVTGDWPSDDELLSLCDGAPGAPFGGSISSAYDNNRKKHVSVYTD